MKRPWSVSVIDNRVSILDAEHRKMTEIEPGQVKGQVVTFQERLAIAEFIIAAVNRSED